MSPVSRRRKKSKGNGSRREVVRRREAQTAYLGEKRDSRDDRYWHGGRAGLEPGTILIPRAVAEREGADLAHYVGQPGYDLGVTDAERVYFSSSREFARAFAGRIQIVDAETGVVRAHGALYEVEPIGDIEKDPDFERVSWCAPRARIVAVHEPDVRLTAYEVTERTGPHTGWLDGSPVYTPEGHYIPSPEQEAAPLHPIFTALHPWTPIEFVNAWIAGRPSGNRPSPNDHPGVLIGGTEAGQVLMQHAARATALLERDVEFSPRALPHLEAINRLLDGRAVVREDDERGIVIAYHSRDGVIGALLITVGLFGDQVGMFIDALAVAPTWQRQGLGSVLLLTAHQVLPSQPAFAAGHCDPDTARFFAQAGYTVLRPGTPLPVVLGDEPRLFGGSAEECWFYRQGPV